MTTTQPSTVTRMLTKALRLGGLITLAIAVVGGAIGYAVAGGPGLAGAALGAALTGIFMGFTAGSLLIGTRVARGDMMNPAFFGIVMGGWLLKLILFVVVILALRGAPWVEPRVFFVAVLAAVIGSLAVDVYVFVTSRVPYVSDVELPTAPVDDV